jgi:hypothetical protein
MPITPAMARRVVGPPSTFVVMAVWVILSPATESSPTLVVWVVVVVILSPPTTSPPICYRLRLRC